MTFELAVRAFESRFADNWSHTAIKWPNVRLNTKVLTEWVCFNNVPDDSKIAQIGNTSNVNRYFGIISIQIFTRPNTGLLRAKVLADYVSDIWRTFQFSGITMETPEVIEIGVDDGWLQHNVQCSYHRSSYEQVSSP